MSKGKKDPHTKKQEPKVPDYSEHSDSRFTRNICSSTDCTGLIPALPTSEEELEAYEEMYAFCARANRSVPATPEITASVPPVSDIKPSAASAQSRAPH